MDTESEVVRTIGEGDEISCGVLERVVRLGGRRRGYRYRVSRNVFIWPRSRFSFLVWGFEIFLLILYYV